MFKQNIDMDQPLDFSSRGYESPISPGSNSYYGNHLSSSNQNKSRSSFGGNGASTKDEQYWLKREKNNAAAKRSRDARRQKEEQTKLENRILREENERLKHTVRALEEHVSFCPVAKR